jgi:hypothetical protein
MTARIFARLLGALLVLLSSLSDPAKAASPSDSQTVDGVSIYLGVIPAEMVRGHPAEHAESTMHGGRPRESDQFHIVIALFDAKTGARITNADVSAIVRETGLAGVEKKLEPMEIAGTLTYGGYFGMAGRGPFRIVVTIHMPSPARDLKATFEHRHQ